MKMDSDLYVNRRASSEGRLAVLLVWVRNNIQCPHFQGRTSFNPPDAPRAIQLNMQCVSALFHSETIVGMGTGSE